MDSVNFFKQGRDQKGNNFRMIAGKDRDFMYNTAKNLKTFAQKFKINEAALEKSIFLLNVYWNKKGLVGQVGPEKFIAVKDGCDPRTYKNRGMA